MDLSCYLDELIKNWIENTEIEDISYDTELGPWDSDIEYGIEFTIRGIDKSVLIITMYLDGISNPSIYFYNSDIEIRFNGNVSIYDYILKNTQVSSNL